MVLRGLSPQLELVSEEEQEEDLELDEHEAWKGD